ncbi:conserved hypothetical protein [Cupriavidus taiwanensis]|uniref:DUF899 family protein n=1 Tax=Cupriavidus taiwanensis TaxID=164546 RepID=UPI000E12698F|nr:DUF899 family protein [Cupriavidus taiwanensis]SOZ15332.1 conserved hypothetical protein [Cupriavidus taiwanensis]SOZ27576.1 conserved hypothetical protein [Cupriavidus taiwanensis]SOZ45903.1 conserved hypothetical protein [Cupriavidus taiwanensis]SPA13666.1 conserved hypothetical protein [Cupriavidus taiwanensis]
MEATSTLTPATELAQRNPVHFPNESAEYRKARNALLAEEIELRRHIERVAAQRRQLPPGGEVTRRYTFQGEHGPVTLEDLFGDKDTLVVYSYMFGPQRERPCPMCTSVMASWDHKVPDIEQRVALAMIARSPVERLLQAKQERGWTKLKVYADVDGAFTRDYVSPEDADVPGYSVFTRRDGKIRHFWSGEMYALTSDPGQDPRGAPDLDPLWTLLDTTPEGRGGDWYPQLEYGSSGSS